jgi:hypothetical protein
VALGKATAASYSASADGAAECSLTSSPASLQAQGYDYSDATVGQNGVWVPYEFNPHWSHAGYAVLSDVAAFDLPQGGTISETCQPASRSQASSVTMTRVVLRAIRVGTLHVQ